jgi:hypothetical protein
VEYFVYLDLMGCNSSKAFLGNASPSVLYQAGLPAAKARLKSSPNSTSKKELMRISLQPSSGSAAALFLG